MKNKNILITMLAAFTLFAGCSDDFLERPPKDTLVDLNFYKTDEQILAGVAPLYSSSWKSYIDKANFKLGDIRGGTVFRAWGDRDAVEFNITDVSEPNEQAWQAFYVVIAQANLAIYNITTYAGPAPDVTDAIKNHAIAEARFMRATAYTHLVMNYGAVPIIEDNVALLFNPNLKRNTEESVWEFIKRDYEFAAANLPEVSIKPGRVTKWSAEGMLARTHLTLAGLNGSPRDMQHLNKAKEYAQRVITMSGKSLMPNYADLFTYPHDNNTESLFELQWVFSIDPDNGYEASNSMVSQITYTGELAANGDGWGGDLSATWWMLTRYDSLVSKVVKSKVNPQVDSIPEGGLPRFTLDERLHATFMLPGFTYPELTNNSTKAPHVFPNPGATADNSYASIKKYVIGKLPGVTDRQRYPNNTYMLRLAEMYLIYAEAALGNNASTLDPDIIEHYNAVHTRAGLPPLASNKELTWQMIFDERIKEFAMESMAWYDVVRWWYYDPQGAYGFISNQDRALFVAKPNQWPNPTAWTFTKTSWNNPRTFSANEGNFRLKIPSSEVSQVPSLNEEPVAYEFKD
jgi:hypothetical protein